MRSNPVWERAYEFALDEVEQNRIRRGLMAMAVAKAEGDKSKAIAFYLETRAHELMGELSEEFACEDTRAEQAHRDEQERQRFEKIRSLASGLEANSICSALQTSEEILNLLGWNVQRQVVHGRSVSFEVTIKSNGSRKCHILNSVSALRLFAIEQAAGITSNMSSKETDGMS